MPKLSREIKFTDKVVSVDDLGRVVDFFAKSVVSRKNSTSFGEKQTIRVSTITSDEVDYSFDESELEDLKAHFQQKTFKSISINYSDYKTDNDISFRITTSEYDSLQN